MTGSGPFYCDICGRTFYNHIQLVEHDCHPEREAHV